MDRRDRSAARRTLRRPRRRGRTNGNVVAGAGRVVKPAISVVIATKDRAPFLERALVSLETQTLAEPFEVIVADNGSSDDTRDVVRRVRASARFAVEYVY